MARGNAERPAKRGTTDPLLAELQATLGKPKAGETPSPVVPETESSKPESKIVADFKKFIGEAAKNEAPDTLAELKAIYGDKIPPDVEGRWRRMKNPKTRVEYVAALRAEEEKRKAKKTRKPRAKPAKPAASAKVVADPSSGETSFNSHSVPSVDASGMSEIRHVQEEAPAAANAISQSPAETAPAASTAETAEQPDDIQRLRAEVQALEAEAAKPGARKDIEKDILMREGALRALEAAKAAGPKGEAKTGRAREIRERLAVLEREAASPADHRRNHDELEKEVLALEKKLRALETGTPASVKKPDTGFFTARNKPIDEKAESVEESPEAQWSPSPLEEQQSAVQGELYERYRRNANGPFEFDAVPESVREKVKDFFETQSKNIPPGGAIPESEINAFLAEQLAVTGESDEQSADRVMTAEPAHEGTDRSPEAEDILQSQSAKGRIELPYSRETPVPEEADPAEPSLPAGEAGPIDEPIIPNPDDAIDPEHAWAMRRAGATGEAKKRSKKDSLRGGVMIETRGDSLDGDDLEYVTILPEGTRREWYEKLADLIKKLTK